MVIRSTVFVTIIVALPIAVHSCGTSGICGAAPYCQQPMMSAPMHCQCAPSYGCGQYGCYRLRAKASRNIAACGTSGICGAAPYCQQPMMSAPMHCQCAPSYGCGQYGCYRLRAKASRNIAAVDGDTSPSLAALHRLRVSQISRCVDLQNPNEAFLSCCMDRQLPDACLRKCNFNSYNKEVLIAMYFKQDACPLDAMKEMQFCAAQGRDHRQCCIRNGVTTTLAGAKCLVFCDQRPGMVTQLDLSYLSCFERFENMKSCFWHDINRLSWRA
uniref:DB domain-containing protein n=1 Tax=Ascaris lumbricoides TaxID=6252 RepID=A0A0M3IE22_ASCLU